ncbi:hypothetical protein PHSY_000497 [Pseudozyma hubeiensis SY62]|uniref:Enoyl reductase (ER) domain-containing protein n=1 Tax=Pseudozyma hubeiensis (strain SY62) TaxID=1305764 RepID=R9NWF9_PSEHS|nr:hypothetical protein PHSY_000497 [Pseudozyma hubeiensis SY62]GAC92938.1 hypothetical protein PHSY_000497 [Pseudozyma hubeiensis SY62]
MPAMSVPHKSGNDDRVRCHQISASRSASIDLKPFFAGPYRDLGWSFENMIPWHTHRDSSDAKCWNQNEARITYIMSGYSASRSEDMAQIWRIHKKGLPPVTMQLDTVAIAEPQQDEVLVKVHSAAVNPVEWKIAAHAPAFIQRFPRGMGTDFSGTVLRTGPGLTSEELELYKPGTSVIGMMARLTSRTSLPSILTCLAVRENDVVQTLRRDHSAKPFDLILDTVGDFAVFRACPAFLKESGEYANVGASDMRPDGSIWSILNFLRNMTSIFLPWWLGGVPRKSTPGGSIRDGLPEFIDKYLVNKSVRCPVDSTFGFQDAPKAYERLMTGRALGKIIVKVD